MPARVGSMMVGLPVAGLPLLNCTSLTQLRQYSVMSSLRSSTEQKHFLQERSEIASVLDQLPFEQLQILEFSFIEGLTQSEIAAKLSLPLGTVKSRMRGAFENLHFGTEREI
jgi:RNA polymerase sigma factor (sigma-70 family)